MDLYKEILDYSKNNNQLLLKDIGYTYRNFYIDTQKIYNKLKKIIKQKEVIALSAGYSKEFICFLFAAYKNKNIVTLINPTAAINEKEYIIKNSLASLVITDNDNHFKEIKKKSFFGHHFFKTGRKNKYLNKNDRFIIFTSGTTGKPKGAIITNKNLYSNVSGISRQINFKKITHTSIIFSPPSYAMAISQILTYMKNKINFIFIPSGIKFPRLIVQNIIKYKVNFLNISISALRILSPLLKQNKKYFNKIKHVMAGGMQMTDQDLKKYFEFFPNTKVTNFYGCTENSPRISHFTINKFSAKKYNIWPVGKPLRGVKIKIIKKINKIGKIFISGSSLMRGYFREKIISNTKFNNGWFNTGDLGYFDNNKNLILTGREDDSFRVGHEKLCPEEIESILKGKFKNIEMIVSKIKNNVLQWEPVLVINRKKNNLDSLKLKKILFNDLSNFKIPKKIYHLKSFPRTSYGKYDRKKIYERIKKFR